MILIKYSEKENNYFHKKINNKNRKFEIWKERAKKLIRDRKEKEGSEIIIIKFFISPILLLLGFIILYFSLEINTFLKISGFMAAYFFPPLGKESVIPIAIAAGMQPFLIAMCIAFLDLIAALFLVWNYDFVKLAPYLGSWMDRLEKRSIDISKGRIWIKGLEFIGVILFVMFPFQGSGGVGGTIIGRLFGINKYLVFLAIGIGSISSSLIIAYSANTIRNIFLTNYIGGIILIIIIAFLFIIYLIHKKGKK